ncbi:MAG: hypothetical protein HUJ83_05730 [Veillonella sp.]|nr:hypothetical protein [Veillonella sp.]
MIIKVITKTLKLTVALGNQLVKALKLEIKREIKSKENQITKLQEYKQQLSEELLVVEFKRNNLEIEKKKLEEIVEKGL